MPEPSADIPRGKDTQRDTADDPHLQPTPTASPGCASAPGPGSSGRHALLGPAGPAYRRLAEAGLEVTPPSSPYGDQPAVQHAFLQSLKTIDNVTVLPLSADNARQALQDQILQRPPGRRKDGVKTGAADSAWLRDLSDHAGGDLSRVLLVSADADVRRACQQWQIPAPLLRGWGQLLETLFTFTLDDSDATVTRLIVGYLEDRLNQDPSGPCGFTVTADPRHLADLAEQTLGSGWHKQVISAELTHLEQLVGLINVAVQTPDPAAADPTPGRPVIHTALARVCLLGTAEFLYRENEETRTWQEHDVLVCADLAFEIQDGGVVIGADSRREAAVMRPFWFDDSSQALQEVCEALSTIPLLGFPDCWPDSQDYVELTGPGGTPVYAELERRDPWSAWRLTLAVGDPAEWAELICEHVEEATWVAPDPDPAEADVFPDPPFELRVSSGPLPHRNPAWGLAAWVMSRLRM
ncbi:hypothetical protein [Nonomuraea basaltis]|uniref:hypothetical protein n=1 Tax=Nonomuraea basaltis TaxID=2495887 RepID=UPI00110C6A4B|nr:hypothetical protein [Nonomuraea basaltis]TMR90162.1 hypothetical protein EJK15_56815 [Nonomuraea basaltis]